MRYVFAGLGCVLLAACASLEPPPTYRAVFEHTPTQRASPGEAEVTVALVAPSFAEQEDWTRTPPYSDFSKSLASDFDELLSARGYLVKGPFISHEAMLYPDKQGSDLVLVPALEIDVETTQPTRRRMELISSKVQLQGVATLSGRVTFHLLESITGTRMWAKDIDVPERQVEWLGERWFEGDNAWTIVEVYTDHGFTNAIAPELESLYGEILETAWDYLHPEELQLVKAQAKPVRDKAIGVSGR